MSQRVRAKSESQSADTSHHVVAGLPSREGVTTIFARHHPDPEGDEICRAECSALPFFARASGMTQISAQGRRPPRSGQLAAVTRTGIRHRSCSRSTTLPAFVPSTPRIEPDIISVLLGNGEQDRSGVVIFGADSHWSGLDLVEEPLASQAAVNMSTTKDYYLEKPTHGV